MLVESPKGNNGRIRSDSQIENWSRREHRRTSPAWLQWPSYVVGSRRFDLFGVSSSSGGLLEVTVDVKNANRMRLETVPVAGDDARAVDGILSSCLWGQ